MAPPASGDDKERYQLNQQFEDMSAAQQANRELKRANAAPPPDALPTAGAPASPAPPAKPVKRGPAEQAPPQPASPTK